MQSTIIAFYKSFFCCFIIRTFKGKETFENSYKENKVSKLIPVGDGIYETDVQGSGKETYHVVVDIPHPRRSKCNCPHADGKRIICKHIVAAYFTVHPEEADRLYREAMEYGAEEEKRQAEIADKLPSLIHKMKKGDLESALLKVLYSLCQKK